MTETIIKKEGAQPGKTIAVFCGTHGNEKAGVYAVKRLLDDVSIIAGTVYFVFANPKAIEANIRFTEKNLNRCFLKSQQGTTYEEKRARELMLILDQCDALLDVHASNSPDTTPFAITDNGDEVVSNMAFEIVGSGFDALEPGATDGYMKKNNKIGICIECGYSGDSEKNTDLAYNSILQYLQYFECITPLVEMAQPQQKRLQVTHIEKVPSENFSLTRSFADFETIPRGTILATDGDKQYITETESVIIFGSPGKPVGAHAYILGTWV